MNTYKELELVEEELTNFLSSIELTIETNVEEIEILKPVFNIAKEYAKTLFVINENYQNKTIDLNNEANVQFVNDKVRDCSIFIKEAKELIEKYF